MRRADGRAVRAIAGWCLHYPDAELYDALPVLRAATTELAEVPSGLTGILDHLETTSELDAGRHYVDVFDARPRRGLYLTWYSEGDTRRRGAALAALARTYTDAGFRPASDELPDFLPTVLEFVVAEPGRAAEELLGAHAPAVQMLRDNLARIDTPYTGVIDAVLDTVRVPVGPPPAPRPPEQVGLDPFPARRSGVDRPGVHTLGVHTGGSA